jgi:hypothetical protein
MNAIVTSFLMSLFLTLSVNAQTISTDSSKERIDTIGIIEVVKADTSLKLVTADNEYMIWTKPVIEKLKSMIGKKVRIKGVTRPTKDGSRKHIVYLQSFKAVD